MSDSRTTTTVAVGEHVIEIIERTLVYGTRVPGAIVGVAVKEPVEVIVRSPNGIQRIAVV